MCSKRPEREAVAAVHSIGMPSVPARSLSREEEEEATLSLPLSLSLLIVGVRSRSVERPFSFRSKRERERERDVSVVWSVAAASSAAGSRAVMPRRSRRSKPRVTYADACVRYRALL